MLILMMNVCQHASSGMQVWGQPLCLNIGYVFYFSWSMITFVYACIQHVTTSLLDSCKPSSSGSGHC